MAGGMNRRVFLGQSGATAAATGLAFNAVRAAEAPSNKVVVGVMGLSRGRSLAMSFAAQPGVEVKYLCDTDIERANSAVKLFEGKNLSLPKPIQDFRKILDDKEIDALVCAAPNHWHAPSTILACSAGKHVYVEKPCSHNPQEGEWMVEAARKYKRAVQMGTQRRSGPQTIEAMQKLHEGVIGRVYLVRAWYYSARGPIGIGKPADVPKRLNYDLWQGPAPRVPYIDNRIHYNWHWLWHWGNGELGNNGVHTLDLCRWGMDVNYPIRVSSNGGRYHFEDDQQTPDTHTVAFEFEGRRSITWQGLSCNKHREYRKKGEQPTIVRFFGDKGALDLDSNGGHKIYDHTDKLVETVAGKSRGDTEHITNFLSAIRNDTPLKLNAEIEKGHQSTLLCHLGNISQRAGRTLNCNPKNGHIIGDEPAMKMWQRDYEPGWEPKV